jgi:predicted permease
MTDVVRPPSVPRWLVDQCLRGEAREAILGDLEERLRDAMAEGASADRARRRYWRDALASIVSARRPQPPPSQGLSMARSSFGSRFGGSWFRGSVGDMRYVVRTLAASPAFVLVAVLSLAIGIGANVAMFGVIRAVMFQELPVTRPAELRFVRWSQSKARSQKTMNFNSDGSNYSYPGFLALRAAAAGRADLFGFNFIRSLNLAASNEPAIVGNGLIVSREYFSTLGLSVALGRPLGGADEEPGAPPVAVISHGLWLRLFGGDGRVIGRTLAINRVPFEIVGVTPAAFRGLSVGGFFPVTDVTVALPAQPIVAPSWASDAVPLTADLNRNWLRVMIRLRPGAETSRLTSAFAEGLQRVETAAGGLEAGWHAAVTLPPGGRGVNSVRDRAEQPLTVLEVISGLVLLMACTNLAGLMLARGLARQRDIAVRRALGASRAALVRHWALESLLLSAAGGASGLVVAVWSGPVIGRLVTAGLGSVTIDLAIDWPLLAIAIAATVVTALLCAVIPAVRLTRADAMGDLRTRVVGSLSPKLTIGRVLIAGQVAISVPLLVGAFLFLRTLHNLGSVELGFDPHSLVIFEINPVADHAAVLSAKAMASPEKVRRTGDILDRLEAIPGVASATIFENTLVSGWVSNTRVTIAGKDTSMLMNAVGPRYFETMRIPLVAGRGLTLADDASASLVVVVNRAAADRYFPRASPIGQRFLVGLRSVEIVGVVGNSIYDSLRNAPQPVFYDSYLQRPGGTYATSIAVRTSVAPDRLVASLGAAVASVDRDLPITNVRSEEDQIDETTGKERVFTRLLTLFGAFALVLVCVGLYGLTSYAVTRRTNEIGIRLALGARRQQVLWMILRQVVMLAGVGLVVGVPTALAVGRFVSAFLYGVRPRDPVTIGSAAVALLVVAIAAGWLPARRAARMEALSALRCE